MRSPPPSAIKRSAQFDSTRQYRYRLDRHWNGARPPISLIMLNPSRADHQQDDPTLRRCIGLAQAWHYGSLIVVNLFAYCTASPKVLNSVENPVGDRNDAFILQACEIGACIVLAWGNWGKLHGRDRHVLNLLAPHRDRLYCLGTNRTGQPRHPLYMPRYTRLIPWTGGNTVRLAELSTWK